MKNIYITWHYTNYGIAFLKHVLAFFFSNKRLLDNKNIERERICQLEMNQIFDQKTSEGFLFDKIFYLTTMQSSFDKISSRRFYYRKSILDDPKIKDEGTLEIWTEALNLGFEEDYLQNELNFVKKNYPEKYEIFCSQIWRNIQHYPIKDQIDWFLNYSNFTQHYNKNNVEIVELKVSDLRNIEEIAKSLYNWLATIKKKYPDDQFIINVSLGSNETQVVWHILSELGYLPEKTRFINTYDDKLDDSGDRFKKFSIKEIPSNLTIKVNESLKIFENTKSVKRDLANLKMKTFIDAGFTILLLGERGTGKSRLAKNYSNTSTNKDRKQFEMIEANCASFEDNSMAESELFGYEKGSFTGAHQKTPGLFQKADKGILFLDEVHHLSKPVQAKLMLAIQTDENNVFDIRKIGAKEPDRVQCILIFASNKSVAELKDLLLPDFYDRIAQLIIEIPSLRETPEDRETDWQNIWEQMKFGKKKDAPKDKTMMNYLKQQPLYGNFRDLQLIALYYKVFGDFDSKTQKLSGAKTNTEYAIQEFEKYHNQKNLNEKFNFSLEKTVKEMDTEYHIEFIKWALSQFSTLTEVKKHYDISYKTLQNWKKGN